MLWDIFCKVIDNHGDIGVCWRLSAQLAGRGEHVRLWVDDASALQWMAPGGHPLVDVRHWLAPAAAEPGDVVIEAFGCELDASFQQEIAKCTRARGRQPVWLNLEYLTAEPFARRSHGLPSPVLSGPAAGLMKYFFYPGFTPDTGGLLREDDLGRRQAAFDRRAWLQARGIAPAAGERVVSLFCYEPAGLPQMLAHWVAGPEPTRLLVTAGRATAAVRQALEHTAPNPGHLAVTFLPLMPQDEFDHLLWSCGLNFVRGEDSLVRALWAGRPFVWQPYPQADGAHHAKLAALLEWLQAPPSLRAFHRFWNDDGPPAAPCLGEWASCAAAARAQLMGQDGLVANLLAFAAAHRQ